MRYLNDIYIYIYISIFDFYVSNDAVNKNRQTILHSKHLSTKLHIITSCLLSNVYDNKSIKIRPYSNIYSIAFKNVFASYNLGRQLNLIYCI